MKHFIAASLAFSAPVFLLGCASVNPTPAFRDVQHTVAGRTGQRVEWMQTPETPALPDELTADTTVAFVLRNNRALQATLEEIGISQAELAQATRLKNPEFAASWRFPDRPPLAGNVEYSIAQDFLDLIILPLRKKVAAQQLEQTKARVAVSKQLESLSGLMKSSVSELQGMLGGEMGQSMQQLRESAAKGEGQMRSTMDIAKEVGSGIARQQEMRKARGKMLFDQYKQKMGMVQPEAAKAATEAPAPERQKIAE